LLATIAEVPPVVFFCLNLNDTFDLMFQIPNLAIMTIASTRMYRSLISLGNTEVSSEVPGAWHSVSKLRFHSRSVPLKQMSVQVSLRTDNDQHPTSQSKVEAQTPAQSLTG
jgi:hypothetical protein